MTRFVRFAVAAAACAVLASAQPAVRLRRRTVTVNSRQPASAGHQILQFDSYPGPTLQMELARRGIRVLEYVPDNALMVSLPSPASLRGLAFKFAAPLEPADKIASGLAESSARHYLAIFHADANAERIRELARISGFQIVENPSLARTHLVLAGPADRLATLAAQDELAFVMEASVDLAAGAPVLSCPSPLSAAGSVGEYAGLSDGWPKDASGAVALKYIFESVTPKAGANSVRAEIERAFREWAKYTNISFSEAASADSAQTIAIQFVAGLHGDVYPFDGPGNILAHTFYPAALNPEPLAGDMHFDGDEAWNIGAATDVFSVALHEAGHALGLPHSTDPNAVMYPYYRLATGLAASDIAAIQDLYGVLVSSTPPVPPVTPPLSAPAPPSEPVPPTAPAPPSPPVPPAPPAPPAAPAPPSAPPPPAGPAPPGSPAPSDDTTAPSLHVISPAVTIVSTTSSALAVSGTAADNTAVTSVKWTTGTGDSGLATGTTSWSATVPLRTGTNVITIRAYDPAGNSGWRSITVVKH